MNPSGPIKNDFRKQYSPRWPAPHLAKGTATAETTAVIHDYNPTSELVFRCKPGKSEDFVMQCAHEHHLLEMAARGNNSAIDHLFCRYRTRLCLMISTLLHPQLSARVEPEDIIQDTLVCAVIRLPRYLENRPVAFFPWLKSLAIDQLIRTHRQHLQSQRRSIHREHTRHGLRCSLAENWEQLIASRDLTPSHHAIARETREHIRKIINRLGQSEREILTMRYTLQMSIRAIADDMSISPAAAKSRLWRAQRAGLLRSVS